MINNCNMIIHSNRSGQKTDFFLFLKSSQETNLLELLIEYFHFSFLEIASLQTKGEEEEHNIFIIAQVVWKSICFSFLRQALKKKKKKTGFLLVSICEVTNSKSSEPFATCFKMFVHFLFKRWRINVSIFYTYTQLNVLISAKWQGKCQEAELSSSFLICMCLRELIILTIIYWQP